MRCTRISLARRAVVVSALVGALALGLPGAVCAESRHHIAIQLGYTKLTSDQLKDASLGVDFTNAFSGTLQYRYSLTPQFDGTIDSRATVSTSTATDPFSGQSLDLTLTNNYFGPGVRWNLSPQAPHPFLQANFYLVSENFEADVNGTKVSNSDSSAGFGVSGGVDFPISKLLSIPVEVHYLYGKPADDVSGVGLQVGLAWNFGAER
jgi:hypothetical protein